jgi:iron complex outermembrane receptor protein
MKSFSLFALVVFLAAGSLPAQTPAVVVTARALDDDSLTVQNLITAEERAAETPGGANVVDAATYRRGRANTLKDALDYSPGVFVQSRFGAEESRLSIRGSGIQRTFHGRGLQLLQDGVPLNLADGGFDFQAVEPLAARYVEVYRGANALQYGGATLGGSINFVSPTGRDADPALVRAEYGSYNTFRAQAASGFAAGPFDAFVSLTGLYSDGFRDHSRQDNQRLFANFGYRFNDKLETRFYVTAVRTRSQLPGDLTKAQLEDDPTQAARNPGFAIFDYVLSDWQRNFNLLRVANKTAWRIDDNQTLTLGAYWSHKDLDHPILFVIDQLSNDFGGNLIYRNTAEIFGRRNRFTLGVDGIFGALEDNRFANVLGRRGARIADNHQESLNLNLFGENTFYLLPKLGLVTGFQLIYARRDNRDDFPASPDGSDDFDYYGFNPKAGFLYELTPKSQIYGNVSRSFEPPSFGELTNNVNGGDGLTSLRPQSATTLEIGTRGEQGPVSWDVSYYYAFLDRELLSLQVLPGTTATVNAGRTIHQGVELGLNVDLLGFCPRASAALAGKDGKKAVANNAESEPARDRLMLRQVYLFNNFRFGGDRDFGDNQLAGLPEHYYHAELVYEHHSGFYLGPNAEWVPYGYPVDLANTLYSEGYALLGAKIGYRSLRGFSVYLEAKNLTDEHYAATTEAVNTAAANSAQFLPGDGRSFFGGVEFRW